ncbi:MAG TPA: PHB depolymerase family esterase, partial [Arenimonas sp.]|nr:PHB depolymerase family esterase [Arenimonas sp.]
MSLICRRDVTRSTTARRPRKAYTPMLATPILALLLLALASASQAWAAELATPRTIVVDGKQRKFNVFAPPGAKRAALIITLHGHGQSARQMEALTGWNVVAAEHGAVVVYPLARGARWRIFGASSPDVDFLLALIDQLASEGLVDPARVFVNGYSGGAQMSWRFACQVP